MGTSTVSFPTRFFVATPSREMTSILADRTHTRQNTVSAVVGRLVRAGPASPTETLITGFDAIAPRQLRGLARGLAALVDSLDLNADDAPMLFEDARRRH